MRMQYFYFFIFCFSGFFNGKASKYDKDSLKIIFDKEFTKFAPVCKFHYISLGKITYSDQATSHIDFTEDNININLGKIENYVKNKSGKFKSGFAKFVIAHELGHRLQALMHGKEVFKQQEGNSSNSLTSVFLECSADIYAGILVTEVFNMMEIPELKANNPSFNLEQYNEDNKNLYFDLFKQIIEMDRSNLLIKTHPSNEQRLNAFKNGKMAGDIFIFNFRYKNKGFDSSYTAETIENWRDIYAIMGKGIGYNPDTIDIYEWVYTEAISILNEKNNLLNNLVLYDKKVVWNETAENPTVDFYFKILNLNNQPINLNGRIFIEAVPRFDSKNIFKRVAVDALSFNENIKQQDTITIQGRLNWKDSADKDYMPFINLPDSSSSLYWASSSNPDIKVKEINTSDISLFNYDRNICDDNSIDMFIEDINYLSSHSKDFSVFFKGIGFSPLAETALKARSGSIIYRPKFISENECDDIYFWKFDNRISLIATCFNFQNFDKAITGFHKIDESIRKSFPDYEIKLPKASQDNRIDYYKKGKKILDLTLKKNKLNEYEIQIRLLEEK